MFAWLGIQTSPAHSLMPAPNALLGEISFQSANTSLSIDIAHVRWHIF